MTTIGTAGWTIPRAIASSFASDGKHLERYARVLHCVEINSSFHRPHRVATYARWAGETPDGFRFSVKLPKTVTHGARLRGADELLDPFIAEVAGLGSRLGVLLVQLPPSLAFEADVVDAFFTALNARYAGAVVCEPRHRSWFSAEADALLVQRRVARAAADPASTPQAAVPGGWLGAHGDGRGALVYHRWHGSPRMYWSAYEDAWLEQQAAAVRQWPKDCDVWCMFDNTAGGAALGDALRLSTMIGQARSRRATSRAITAAPPR